MTYSLINRNRFSIRITANRTGNCLHALCATAGRGCNTCRISMVFYSILLYTLTTLNTIVLAAIFATSNMNINSIYICDIVSYRRSCLYFIVVATATTSVCINRGSCTAYNSGAYDSIAMTECFLAYTAIISVTATSFDTSSCLVPFMTKSSNVAFVIYIATLAIYTVVCSVAAVNTSGINYNNVSIAVSICRDTLNLGIIALQASICFDACFTTGRICRDNTVIPIVTRLLAIGIRTVLTYCLSGTGCLTARARFYLIIVAIVCCTATSMSIITIGDVVSRKLMTNGLTILKGSATRLTAVYARTIICSLFGTVSSCCKITALRQCCGKAMIYRKSVSCITRLTNSLMSTCGSTTVASLCFTDITTGKAFLRMSTVAIGHPTRNNVTKGLPLSCFTNNAGLCLGTGSG